MVLCLLAYFITEITRWRSRFNVSESGEGIQKSSSPDSDIVVMDTLATQY